MNAIDPIKSLEDIRKMKEFLAKKPRNALLFENFYLFPIQKSLTDITQNIDISLYPLFYDVIQMNMLNRSENTRFELAETQASI